jgi:hypothetical protein
MAASPKMGYGRWSNNHNSKVADGIGVNSSLLALPFPCPDSPDSTDSLIM